MSYKKSENWASLTTIVTRLFDGLEVGVRVVVKPDLSLKVQLSNVDHQVLKEQLTELTSYIVVGCEDGLDGAYRFEVERVVESQALNLYEVYLQGEKVRKKRNHDL